jgi:hypothetical protein
VFSARWNPGPGPGRRRCAPELKDVEQLVGLVDAVAERARPDPRLGPLRRQRGRRAVVDQPEAERRQHGRVERLGSVVVADADRERGG